MSVSPTPFATTIACKYCNARLSFQGLPAHRYADHLLSAHKIFNKQDEVIFETIRAEFPGFLPPPDCHCVKAVVKLEKPPEKEQLALKMIEAYGMEESEDDEVADYKKNVVMKTSSSQTTVKMCDAMCQTVELMKRTLETLDAAVQTVGLSIEARTDIGISFAAGPEVGISFENETEEESMDVGDADGDRIISSKQNSDFLNFSEKNKIGSSYPCMMCKKLFPSVNELETHHFKTHQISFEILNPEEIPPPIYKSQEGYSPNSTKSRENFSPTKSQEGPSPQHTKSQGVTTPHLAKSQENPSSNPAKSHGDAPPDSSRSEQQISPSSAKLLKHNPLNNGDDNPSKSEEEPSHNLSNSEEDPSQNLSKSVEDPSQNFSESEKQTTLPDNAITEVLKKSSGKKTLDKIKGFASKGAYKKGKRFTNKKQKPWCKYCWVRFPNRLVYEEHRKEMHSDIVTTTRERSSSATCSEVSEASTGKSKIELSFPVLSENEHISDLEHLETRTSTPVAPSTPVNSVPGETMMEVDEADLEDVQDDKASMDEMVEPEIDEELRTQLTRECEARPLKIELVKVDLALTISDQGDFGLNPSLESPRAEDGTLFETEDCASVSEMTMTLAWYEGRHHHCLLCERFLPLGTFSNHVIDSHGLSMILYREKFPSDVLTAKVWTCSLCEKKLNWTQPAISRHLKSIHSLSLQEYSATVLENSSMATKQLRVDLSLPWYESRRLRCCICDTLLLFSQLADHLKSNHDCTYTGYKLMFPSSCPDLPPWKCQICSHKTPWTRRNIHHHLNAKHEMSIEDYGTEYVEDMKADSVEEAIIKENVDEAIVKLENGEVPSTSSTRPVKLEARESTPSKKTMSRDMVKVGSDEKLWVPWFESRLHKCNLCGEVRTCGLSFKNHIYDKHQFMSRKQYCQRFPHADIEPKAWNCSLCRNTVKWTKKCIVDHLKTAHAMSRDDFETMFNMPAKHMIDAPAGGKYDVNARTDLGLANKAGTTTENVSLEDLCEVASKAEENAALEDLCELAIEEKNDSSRVQCGLCDDQVGSLADHVRDYHHMGKEAYLKICPSDAARFAQKKRSQVWTCRICEETMENSQENVKNHLDVHAIDIKDYDKTFDTSMADEEEEEEIVLPDAEIVMGEVEENTREHSSERDSKPIEVESSEEEPGRDSPWYEAIKITCEECHNSFWLGQFMKHIILTHKLPIKVYKAKYPETIIPKRQYTCRVCGCGVSHYASPISGHLTGRHNMTMTEYYEKYEKLQVEPPELTPALVVDLPDSSFALETAEEDNANLDNPNIKNQRMAEFQKSGKIPWYECKTTICRFCGEEWLLGSFRRHLYDRHDKVSRTAYAEMFPDADITLPTWTCKICRNGVRWVRDNIFYHLRTHNFTMEGYRQLYIDGNGPPPTSPSNKPIPNLVPIKAEAHEGKQFRCKLCSMLVAFESGSIKNHLKTFHNMSINDYQPISHVRSFGGAPQGFSPGAPGFSPGFPMTDNFLDVAAPPANMGLGFSPSIFGPMPNLPMPPQLQKMAEPLGSGQPWYNRCKWTCNVCDKAFSSGFWRHVQEAHSTKKEDYLREYGKKGIEIIHYFCKICSKKVPWSGASINAHMKGEHGKTLKEYELEYGPDTEPIVVPQQVLEIPNMPLYKTLPRLHQFANQNQQIHYVHSSNNWFNGCEYKCQICSRVLYSVAGLSMHLKDTHMLDKFAYFREYGRAGINIRKYKCKICFKSFPWSGVSISKHVKQAHQVSLQRYSAMYEQGSTTKSIADQDDGFFSPEDAAAAPEAASTPHAKDKVKWYNKCSWTCQICGTTITSNSSAFYKHVVQDHGTPIEEYKEKFGNTGFVFVDHTCKLCQKKIPFNGLSMCKHMKHSHNMQLEEYQQRYMKDDDGTSTGEYYAPTDEFWYNKCIWKCQLCGNKNKSLGSSKKHIQKVHNLTYEDYNDRYGNEGIFEVDFKCKLCRATISCNGVTIASHLLNNHKLTLKEYEKQYLVNGVDAEEDAPEAGPQDGEHFLTGSSKSRSCSPITARDAAAQKDKTWYQKCKYICQICKNPYFSISALRNHTKVKHGMDRDTYVGIYGVDAGKVIEDYICKICNRTLKCEGRSLNAHMRNCHKMGILEYSKKYEATKGTDEDPNLYSEHYQIEMDNDEAAEETQVEDMDESTDELINPLASLVSAELHEEEDVEEDMTAEESLHFNFEEDDEDPDQTLEVKPDIHQLDLEMEMDMVDTTTEYEEGEATFEENQSINEEGVADFDEEGMGTVSMGVIEYDDDAEL